MSSGRITIMRVGGASLSPVGVPALREQRVPSAPSFFAANEGRQDDNPFAPPPRDAPERPWQPRLPSEPHGAQGAQGAQGGAAAPGTAAGGAPAGAPGSPAGDRWSSRQPEPRGGGGPGPTPPPAPSGPRVDLTDPVQRRARYALLAGMWGLFFALFSIPEVGLLLGALALYWGFSALRGRPGGQAAADGTQRAAALAAMENGPPRAASAAPGAPEAWRPSAPSAPVSPYPQRGPQTTAALSGIIAAFVALSVVAATYTFQLVYRDYYSCVSNALTQPAQQACTSLLPKALQPVLGPQNS